MLVAAMVLGMLTLLSCQSEKERAERPAPPDTFVLRLQTGGRMTGPAARVDLSFESLKSAPTVSLHFRAADDAFSGPLVVSCSVPSGAASAPSPASDAGTVLILDSDFSSPACRPFAYLR
jgi:hypothetical protein